MRAMMPSTFPYRLVPLAQFVLDDSPLLVEFRLGDSAQHMPHPVRFHPKGNVKGPVGTFSK